MVIEESSVVAAAAKSANFWYDRGGFKAEVINTLKVGQVHFSFQGPKERLTDLFEKHKEELLERTQFLSENMKKRGGGLRSIKLKHFDHLEPHYHQIHAEFETCDAMGANYINSVLEHMAKVWEEILASCAPVVDYQIVMSILSNYTPHCVVKASVECSIDQLDDICEDMTGLEFAKKFSQAVRIAEIDTFRATTHNKGIMNGIDAVVLATGNDFRAVEACAHAYAAKEGIYKSLSHCEIRDQKFHFSIEIPLALGTVGGLTSLHPLVSFSLDLLGRPDAKELMMIVASTGLAQNFGAIRSLVTTGIQKGHMKMHLINILNSLSANQVEVEKSKEYFSDKVVSFQAVREYINQLRSYQ